MKKIILLFVLLSATLFAKIEWLDYEDALEVAQKENKIVMVMLSREGCMGCEYMQDIVFVDKEVLKKLNKDFIGVYVDLEQDFAPEGLSYVGTPTFHFVDKNEKQIDRIDGGVNIKDFTNKLNSVLEAKK